MKKKMLNLLENKSINDEYNKLEPIFKMIGFILKRDKENIIIYDQNGNTIGLLHMNSTFETEIGTLQINHKYGQYHIELIKGKKRIGLCVDNKQSKPSISVQLIKSEGTNSSVFFMISFDTINAYIANFYIPGSSYSANCLRSFKYTDINKSYGKFPNQSFIDYQAENNNDYKKIKLADVEVWSDKFALTIDTNENNKKSYNSYFLNHAKVDEIAREILKMEDVHFTINSVLSIIEKELPGFIDYINDNMELFSELKSIFVNRENPELSMKVSDIKELASNNNLYLIDHLNNEDNNGTTYKKQ
jgi:hypothetical protein